MPDWFLGLRLFAVPLAAAEGLEWAARRVAAQIMATPESDPRRLEQLSRAGRLIGESAQNLRDAASILRSLKVREGIAGFNREAGRFSRGEW